MSGRPMLKDILEVKEKEIQTLIENQKGQENPAVISFERPGFALALQKKGFHVIAEVKRKSPSAGQLASIADPVKLASEYASGGATAISVLTDYHFFNGSLQDLKEVAAKIQLPILRKDFIIHPAQIIQTAQAGASAVLLIVAVVGKELKSLISLCKQWGLDALVEVHDLPEIEIALDAGAAIIGVNNRNLKTMEVNLEIAEKLSASIPDSVVKIAESGIKSSIDVLRMKKAGYNGVLIGEMLVKSEHPEQIIKQIKNI